MAATTDEDPCSPSDSCYWSDQGSILIFVAQLPDRLMSSFPASWCTDWLPAALLPMMYWQAGCFAGRLNDSFQRTLQNLDNRFLGEVDVELTTKHKVYRSDFERSFELAYLSCYPLVPLGLVVSTWLRCAAMLPNIGW